MLSLKSSTAPWWLDEVEGHLEEVLIDHAHCEKKAAGTALNLIFAYVDRPSLVRELTELPLHTACDPAAAWKLARGFAEPDDLLVATWSFFLAAEMRELVRD